MNIVVEQIALKRLGKKLWQHENNDPKRVELAVLDYLASKGWHGYFTEHFNYDETLLCMMCWCNRESYFKEKRKSLRVSGITDAFDFATDGFWSFDQHKLSHSDLISNAVNFSVEMIPQILKVWQERGVKSPVVGRAYLKDRSAEELNADALISFYNARGGLKYYRDYLEYFHSSERQQLKSRYRVLHTELKNSQWFNNLLSDDVFIKLLHKVGTNLGIYSDVDGPRTDESIQNWVDKIREYDGIEFKDELLKLAMDIQGYWKRRDSTQSQWCEEATLDLVVWKESVASVEVKAPNDRLKPHQTAQLKLDEENGKKSWVIEVHDG